MKCEECNLEIASKRLQACPNTRFCLDCQELKEEAGELKKYTMKIHQELKGWELQGIETEIVLE